MSTYKLYYFNGRGRAEATRLLFTVAGQKFEDIRYEREEWPAHKSEMPLGQVPVLEVDGVKLVQSMAIARFLAKRFGLYGKDELQQARVDAVIDTAVDLMLKFAPVPKGYDPALNCLFNRDATDDKLDEINIPALVLHGADDRMFPAQDAKEWSSKLPKLWKFEIVERGVHQLSLTEPGDEVVAQLIPQFIKETL
ncbi:unnamed protein product [Rotaria sp. Silwood1]|nr:unnamed protein product [Rotaria sp. Silwood1]CAF3492382.1 unnamed protein product [Rotaria sp. Silwood1]CAF4568872.1 unnamed protein product [Rotaria sp. Silwood1]